MGLLEAEVDIGASIFSGLLNPFFFSLWRGAALCPSFSLTAGPAAVRGLTTYIHATLPRPEWDRSVFALVLSMRAAQMEPSLNVAKKAQWSWK